MADDALEAQLRRLAAIVAPLAETVNDHDARLAQHEAQMARYDTIIEEQRAMNHRLTLAIERIDETLARLIARSANGRDA